MEKKSKESAVSKRETLQDTKKSKIPKKKINNFEKSIAETMELIPDPAMVIDPHGKVMAWNRAMEELTGVRAKNILGKGNYEYSLPFYGERRPVLADIAMQPVEDIGKKYKHITRRGNTLIAEAYVPTLPKGGTHVYGSATILKNSNGEPVGVMEIVCEHKKE